MRRILVLLLALLAGPLDAAMTAIPPYWYPRPIANNGGAPLFSALLMDASAEKVAFCFQAPRAGVLNRFSARLGTVTQAPANGLTFSFRDPDATNGDPDATDDQYRVVTAGLTSNTWVSPGLITSDGTDGGTKRTVALTDTICAVIAFTSFSASDSLNITNLAGQSASINAIGGPWYVDHFTASWAKQTAHYPTLALEYSDGIVYPIYDEILPLSALNTVSTFNTGSTPDERGNRFIPAVGLRVDGLWARVTTGGDVSFVLYDSGSNVLGSCTIDKDLDINTANNSPCLFTQGAQDLTAGATYRMVIKPTSATNVTAYDYDVPSAAYLAAVPTGTSFYSTSRVDAGSWTDVDTKVVWMGLHVTGVNSGGGGASAARVPNGM